MTFILGLTGGIASGKSTVVDFFIEHNVPIIDGDKIARKIVEIGQPALKRIHEVFGSKVIQSTGELDRKALGEIIFSSPSKRAQLDQLMAPYLRLEIERQVTLAKKQAIDLVVVDLPLLYEAGYESLMTKVAVVYVSRTVQLERLIARNQLTTVQAIQRINSQLSLEVKRERADFVFDNSFSKENTKKQVTHWLKINKFIL